MTLDTRALIAATLFLLALLSVLDEPTAFARATGRALLWCLRKLCWLWVVTCLVSLLILAAVVTFTFVGVTELTGFGQHRHIALVMRRRHA